MASDRTVTATRFVLKPLYLQVRDANYRAHRQGGVEAGHGDPELGAREFEISSGTMRKALDTFWKLSGQSRASKVAARTRIGWRGNVQGGERRDSQDLTCFHATGTPRPQIRSLLYCWQPPLP